jgi:SAM-dependent methyltransferase
MAKYSLGSEDPELARLEAQAQFISGPTRVLLASSGLEPGMRVLDLGTGLGHVAEAVAEIVGPSGEVVGLDLDPRMVERAQQRTAGVSNVRFVAGDVTQWRDPESFDAVVGRLILFHLPKPAEVIRHHLEGVRSGGRVVVLDYDIAGLRTEPRDEFTEQMNALVLTAFRTVGADPAIGSKLKLILADAGVEQVEGFAVSQYLDSSNPVGPMMLEGVLRTLAPAIHAHGLATEAELDIDTLATRTSAAMRSTGSVLVPPVLAGAWGRRT